MLRLGPPLEPGARVLAVLPSWLGDVVACEPALRALSERLRAPDGSGLTLAGTRATLPVLDGLLPAAQRVPHAGRGQERASDWRGHDVAVLFPNSFRSAWTAWRAGVPRRVGWIRDGRGWLLTDGMRPAFARGATPPGQRPLGRIARWTAPLAGKRVLPRPFAGTCVELVGLLGAEVHDTRPRVTPGRWPEHPALADLCDGGFLLVNAGGRAGSAKAAPPALWAEALRGAAGLGLPAVLACGPGEEASALAVRDALEAARGQQLDLRLALPALDLSELAAVAAAADLAWTTDSGPLHVLRAQGTPRVVLQGPTDPRHSAEHLEGERRLRRELACSPCHRERCPLTGAEEHACLRGLEPARILAASRALLEPAAR